MKDPLQALLQAANLPKHNLPNSSRYHPIETTQMNGPDDEPVIYLKRRFIPPSEYYFSHQRHYVKEGDRLDNVTAKYISDPEQFWQLADANSAMRPEALVEEPGNIIRIPHAFGITDI